MHLYARSVGLRIQWVSVSASICTGLPGWDARSRLSLDAGKPFGPVFQKQHCPKRVDFSPQELLLSGANATVHSTFGRQGIPEWFRTGTAPGHISPHFFPSAGLAGLQALVLLVYLLSSGCHLLGIWSLLFKHFLCTFLAPVVLPTSWVTVSKPSTLMCVECGLFLWATVSCSLNLIHHLAGIILKITLLWLSQTLFDWLSIPVPLAEWVWSPCEASLANGNR